ncbi:MAG: hypothetical protein ACAH95_05770 [Fimbriimonas sp.]
MQRISKHVCSLFIVGLAGATFAFDYNGVITAWAVGTAEEASTVQQRTTEDWRPTSIDAVSPGSTLTRFVTPYVRNTDSHFKTVLMRSNISSTTLNSYRSAGWRIEDVERTGSTSYSALFTRNDENPVPTGWFVNLTTEQVTSLLGSTRRILELDSVVISGVRKFNGVYVSNTGTAAKAWGWMPDATLKEIMDWAKANAMRVIDIDPRSTSRFSAVFVKRKSGERVYVGAGPWSAISELQEASGTRPVVINKLEGENFYAAVYVNNVNAQSARIADSLVNNSGGGRIGAYVQEIGGSVLVNLRGTQKFYPCSAIKVLIHAAGLAAVPTDQLNTYKVNSVYLGTRAYKMMVNSDNAETYILNSHFGTDYINGYGRSSLGTTTNTFIKDHFGNTPPDNEWNATATLRDMTNIYAKRSVLGTARVAKFRAWMYTDANSGLFDSASVSLANSLGLTQEQYNLWKSRVRFEFKAGNVYFGSNTSYNTHWVNVGRISLPQGSGSLFTSKHYAFGHFVNDSVNGYSMTAAWAHSAALVREQMIESMLKFK